MKPFQVESIEYAIAAEFNQVTHRHLPNAPPKMQIRHCFGIFWHGKLRAIAMVGNPVAPSLARTHLEVRRLASDGLYGACSALYAKSLAFAHLNGRKLVTYTFESESGVSLLASGANIVVTKRYKSRIDTRNGRRNQTSNTHKIRWEWEEARAEDSD